MVRVLLVVNPHATGTDSTLVQRVAHALGREVKLEVATTEVRGHAQQLAEHAAEDEVDALVALGGDGTVNEVVNGLLAHGIGPHVPALGVLPGGSTNVFARALGLPHRIDDAVTSVVDHLVQGQRRSIGLGRCDDRWFTFSAGMGLDATVVGDVETARARGRRSTTTLYLRSTARAYLRTRRNPPQLSVTCDGDAETQQAQLVLVGNTSPWTFLGPRPVDPFPGASFDTGLDALVMDSLGWLATVRASAQLVASGARPLRGRHVQHIHDAHRIEVVSPTPLACQVDGDWIGEKEQITFTSAPAALQVLAAPVTD